MEVRKGERRFLPVRAIPFSSPVYKSSKGHRMIAAAPHSTRGTEGDVTIQLPTFHDYRLALENGSHLFLKTNWTNYFYLKTLEFFQ